MAQLPGGCGYQGYEFGASYPDSICVAGYLWDADNCNEKQELYEPTEEIPCPMCHPRLAERYWTSRIELSGKSFLESRKAAKALVADIRKNRKNGTEPWKTGREV